MSVFDTLGVPVLENHWKVAVASAICWHIIFLTGRWASSKYVPAYRSWDKTRQLDWGIRFASFLNAIVVCSLAFPMLMDPKLNNDKLFGYTEYAGNVNAIILGYFAWDIYVSFLMFDLGFIVHGFSAFTVFFLCFRPFIMYYGAVFIMYELSTPFLNIHWVCDKLGYSGSIFQLVNGIILLVVFFGARIVFGLYSSFDLYVEMYHQFDKIPLYLVISYSALNLVLNSLNIFWFFKMIDSVKRRFQPNGTRETFGESSGTSGIARKNAKKEI